MQLILTENSEIEAMMNPSGMGAEIAKKYKIGLAVCAPDQASQRVMLELIGGYLNPGELPPIMVAPEQNFVSLDRSPHWSKDLERILNKELDNINEQLKRQGKWPYAGPTSWLRYLALRRHSKLKKVMLAQGELVWKGLLDLLAWESALEEDQVVIVNGYNMAWGLLYASYGIQGPPEDADFRTSVFGPCEMKLFQLDSEEFELEFIEQWPKDNQLILVPEETEDQEPE